MVPKSSLKYRNSNYNLIISGIVFDDKNILITGGTGSLGRALTKKLLSYNIKTLRIFSRNENKQIEMGLEFDDPRIRFLIGDIRDSQRLSRAVEDVDIVFHAAALKHVPVVEYNPNEAIMTNVIGSQNVAFECIKNKVEKVVGIGTDKAVSPLNTYGATKLLMEKIFISSIKQFNVQKYPTNLFCVRYGNVVASSGSVIPLFVKQIKSGQKITITDPQMTRFSITMDEAVNFIISSTEMSIGSEVFVPKLKAYNILDIKNTLIELLGDTGFEVIDSRPGEKIHEILINKHEISYTKDIDDRFVILYPQIFDEPKALSSKIQNKYENYKKTSFEKEYSSDSVELLSNNELKSLLKNYI